MADLDHVDIQVKRKKGVSTSTAASISKRAKVKGEEYTNSKGQKIAPIQIGPDCLCKKTCFKKVDELSRIDTLAKFLKYETKNEQDAYLTELINVHDVERKRPRLQDPTKNHSSSFEYFVSTYGKKVKVCKTAFASFHGITAERIRRLCNLLRSGKSPRDLRGANSSGNKLKFDVLELVREHINSFPVREAHYSGRIFKYLSEKLSVNLMYKTFCEKNEDVKISYSKYWQIFREDFILSFGRPQIDTCCTCEALGIKIKSPSLNDVAKRVAVAELMVHKRRCKKFFRKMNEIADLANTDETVGGYCFDYMQNLPLPHIPVQEVFYLRQLWVNIFCIHCLKTNTCKFYVYHEGEGKKGPNEVCSFILDYIQNEIPPEVQHIHLFSDGCAGQNKNHTMIRTLLTLTSLEKFKSINHYFPVRGHSFLPCDRDFGVIKRVLKKCDRVYVPMEYVASIVSSSSTPHKFSVQVVDTSAILNFKEWWPKFYKKMCISLETPKRAPRDRKVFLQISNYMQFVYDCTKPGVLCTYSTIDGMIPNTFHLKNTNFARLALPVKEAYEQGQVPINNKKMQDIKKLIQYIPEEYMYFYDSLFSWSTLDKDNVENLDDEY